MSYIPPKQIGDDLPTYLINATSLALCQVDSDPKDQSSLGKVDGSSEIHRRELKSFESKIIHIGFESFLYKNVNDWKEPESNLLIYELRSFDEFKKIDDHYPDGIFSSEGSSEISKDAESVLLKIKKLFTSNQISEARAELGKALLKGFNTSEFKIWAKLLTRPKAHIGKNAGGSDLEKINIWLENNASRYLGQWIAFKEGEFIDGKSSRVELQNTLKKKDQLKNATIIFLSK